MTVAERVVPTVRVTAMTHRGAVRPGNEDSLVVGALTVTGADMAAPAVIELPLSAPLVIAVADGMGGHAAGEIASAHVATGLSRAALGDAAAITSVLRHLDTQLRDRARSEPGLASMGTTVAGVALGAACGFWFGVGDSRVYREEAGFLSLLSTDDRAPGGALSQCLGGTGGSAEPAVEVIEGQCHRRLLLCSDGLSDLVGIEAMEALLAKPGGSVRAVKALWVAAMNASGRDNISIVLVEVPTDGPSVPVQAAAP